MALTGMERIAALIESNGFRVVPFEQAGRPQILIRFEPGGADRLRETLARAGIEVEVTRGPIVSREDRYIFDRAPGRVAGQRIHSNGRVEDVTHSDGYLLLVGVTDAQLP